MADRFKTNSERNAIASRLVRGKKVLDVGCGRGELMAKLKNRMVYGIDFSEKMLDSSVPNTLIASAEDMPFKNGFFDCVTAIGLIEYLKDDLAFVAESHRVLKLGGYLIISYRNYHFKHYSGRIFEPERRVHDPYNINYVGFSLTDLVFFHKHPRKFQEEKFNHSGFILRFKKHDNYLPQNKG